MKFRITMKDPDGVGDSIQDAVNAIELPGLSQEEADSVREIRDDAIKALCRTWFEYLEYLTVEIDTEAKTCVVVPK